MAGLRVIALWGNIPARIVCIIRGGFLAMIVSVALNYKNYNFYDKVMC